MNDTHHDSHDEWTDAQRAGRNAVRSFPVAEADPDFRAAMREQFVRGEFQKSARPARRAGGRRRAGRRIFTWAAPVAVAAALAIMIGVLNYSADWTVVHAAGTDYVMVDGARVPCDDLSPLQAAIQPGCRVQMPEGGQMEVVTDAMALQINGGTDVTIPTPPGRWFARTIDSDVLGDGTFRVATGPEFEGARYALHTEAATLEITGTAFSVMNSPGTVCICVLDGDVQAKLPDGSTRTIGPGGRLTLALDGSTIDAGSMRPGERDALTDLRERLVTASR